MPRTDVIDLSHHNTVSAGFHDAKAAGVKGIIHKLTEGVTFQDSRWRSRYESAKVVGLLFGVYHFLRTTDPKMQAEWFYHCAPIDQDVLLAVDYEDDQVELSLLKDFLRYAETLFKRPLVIYSGHTLKQKMPQPDPEICNHRLWLAQYSQAPVLPVGFDTAWLWQFTDKGTGFGIGPAFDCNQADDPNALAAEWSGAAAAEPVEPVEPGLPPDVPTVDTYAFDATDIERWPITITLPGGASLGLTLSAGADSN